MNASTLADRVAGCLFGLALGDCLGAGYEGKRPGLPFHVPEELRTTDDTQLTLATCEAIVAAGAISPEAIAARFTVWFQQRRVTGLGASTLKAFQELSVGGHWALSGATGERSAGTGAAMRIAPLGLALSPARENDRRMLRDVARITHRNEEAYVGALAIAMCVDQALRGGIDTNFVRQLAGRLPDSRVRDRLNACWLSTFPDYAGVYGCSGYVVDAVPAAILAATQHTEPLAMFKDVCRQGGDTDTVAAMAGAIWGAANGLQRLPNDLLARIDLAAELRSVSESFTHYLRAAAKKSLPLN